ncbi:putative Glycerol kinase [Cardiosporidium cionae]|uniref:glycerol kinase n=1 Tax=Cardiosporidium cionae TaxID=476202 RepID=A0ABQ7J605_9APIC|nr:putative Glycerol kinase [Cardiosporidium cionae]|eukprot:KAF8819398.1 putative Glycerol kinase [Cardiosporidium cionae]
MEFVGSIDQGTQSTRFTLYDNKLKKLFSASELHEQHYPQSGWCEHDPMEILNNTYTVINTVLVEAKATHSDFKIVSIGITNQRETVVAWDKFTGKPLYNAIVWLDTRTSDIVQRHVDKYGSVDAFRPTVGLPINTYFSAFKIQWLLENVPEVSNAVKEERACIGTIDSWLIWNLTGGLEGGVFVTDITNASRTFLCSVHTQNWAPKLLSVFDIPLSCLPSIRSSSELYGNCVGDQQAACIAQAVFKPGDVKCTFGTGAFILMNTGTNPVLSTRGLLTTPCYQLGSDAPIIWALEGAIAIAGAGVSWMKDNLGLISSPQETEELITSVEDTDGVVCVPAFSGLFAPRWRTDARGAILGLTQHHGKAHIVRAMVEAVAFMLHEIVDAMREELHADTISMVKVDGGMANNNAFLQICANIINFGMARPKNTEVTSVGAAVAAGLSVKFWPHLKHVEELLRSESAIWVPSMDAEFRAKKLKLWEAGIERSLNWTPLYEDSKL